MKPSIKLKLKERFKRKSKFLPRYLFISNKGIIFQSQWLPSNNLSTQNTANKVPVPVDLSKLSNEVKEDVVKKTKNDDIKTTDTSDLVKKATYDTKIIEAQKKVLGHNHDKHITT